MGTAPLTLIFVSLISFGLYLRLRRSFGRQMIRPRAMIARSVVLCALGAFLLVSLPTLPGFSAAVGGALLGTLLAEFALRHTRFETTEQGLFYTPNKWIGVGVTALFLGRLVARLVTAYELAEEAVAFGEPPLERIHRSALTLGLYFLLASYYVGYYVFVMRRAKTPPTDLTVTILP